ncbi:MAG: GIY-YIG nuclease family protein [Patescibacteria group bacterium]|nr:GIY-YIG nuclease family protein [Patescibacteria group bacterium]MDE2014911.1 GIY-YIG nuclease family protein [Patescibacteria group bacterium]MDE2226340.1 GIY-YIG nuclease family protein [Patescibacteria group bacterium]
MFCVYILKSSKDGNLYIGYTDNLGRRLAEHNAGKSQATRPRIPFKLIYCEAYLSAKDAKHREHNLKLHSKALSQLKRRLEDTLIIS